MRGVCFLLLFYLGLIWVIFWIFPLIFKFVKKKINIIRGKKVSFKDSPYYLEMELTVKPNADIDAIEKTVKALSGVVTCKKTQLEQKEI